MMIHSKYNDFNRDCQITFGRGQNDLLLGVDLLQFAGAETLQLALEVDGDLGQILQRWGAHGDCVVWIWFGLK